MCRLSPEFDYFKLLFCRVRQRNTVKKCTKSHSDTCRNHVQVNYLSSLGYCLLRTLSRFRCRRSYLKLPKQILSTQYPSPDTSAVSEGDSELWERCLKCYLIFDKRQKVSDKTGVCFEVKLVESVDPLRYQIQRTVPYLQLMIINLTRWVRSGKVNKMAVTNTAFRFLFPLEMH